MKMHLLTSTIALQQALMTLQTMVGFANQACFQHVSTGGWAKGDRAQSADSQHQYASVYIWEIYDAHAYVQ